MIAPDKRPRAPVRQVRVFIGLGSNLAAPVMQLRQALRALAGLPATRLYAQSSLYRNPPLGPAWQPDFVNAVAELRTDLTPRALLAALQRIEYCQGRCRGRVRWGPRTLDLDILLWGAQQLRLPELIVPHPGIAQRAFVLYPLAELAPELDVPGYGRIEQLLTRVDISTLARID
ncbi:MAG TPA: 2-amino-4-hydroxy-6-hydroxymethyldihydropteridine diphosphokinase [Nitrococcus sp.]|nr:2-amino-4-hydroxy-6-hydroxymethyldihydropteridine diphosphokinase [Nitrococcus sp.]